MSTTEDDTRTDDQQPPEEPSGKPPKLCKNCGERPGGFGKLGRYCEECREAGAGRMEPPKDAPPSRPARPSGPAQPSRRSNAGKLHKKLYDAHFGASMGLILFTNPQILGKVELVDVLEGKSNGWAASTVALAEQDERIAELLERLLKAGVWTTFIVQTVGSIVTVGALSGRLKVPYGAVAFLAPELVPFMTMPAAPVPEGTNGAQPA